MANQIGAGESDIGQP